MNRQFCSKSCSRPLWTLTYEKGFIIVLQEDERLLAATRNVDNTQLDLSARFRYHHQQSC